MNYLLKVKQFTIDSMIAYEELAAEIRDEYYKLLIKVGEGKANHLNFRDFYEIIQHILKKNDNVSPKN